MRRSNGDTDYGPIAGAYDATRWPLESKIEALSDALSRHPVPGLALDVGCGTGDYLAALRDRHPDWSFAGFDVSAEMVAVARRRCPRARLQIADAETGFPYPEEIARFVGSVDLMHHISGHDVYFAECARVLAPGGSLVVLTDSREDIRARGYADYFPETVPINLERYPQIDELNRLAEAAGLDLERRRTAVEELPLEGRFMETLEEKALSELRLLPEEAYAAGIERVRRAAEEGRGWLSQTTVLEYRVSPDRSGETSGSGPGGAAGDEGRRASR